MHILIISSGDFFSTYGGGQVYVKNLVDEMIRQRRDVTLLSYVDRNSGIARKDYHGIDSYEVSQDAKDEDISSTIQEISPDVIHANGHKAQACRIGKSLSIPVVVTAHHGGIVCPNYILLNAKDEICQTTVCHEHCLKCVLRNTRCGTFFYPLLQIVPKQWLLTFGSWLRKKPFIYFVTPIGTSALSIENKKKEWDEIADCCSRMIAPCSAIADAMTRNDIEREKIEIIPHGIPVPTQEKISTKTYVYRKFYYVGRICYVKGIHVMLKAFHKLLYTDIELHIIGGAEKKRDKRYMKALQKKYEEDKRIIWHGKVPHQDLDTIIADYDVLIHPAICLEVFGLNIAETLTIGKPVLATRCGGAEMQVVDGKNGWLIEPNDIEALRNKIEDLVLKGFSFQPADFKVVSIEEHCNELYKVYQGVLDNKSQSFNRNETKTDTL